MAAGICTKSQKRECSSSHHNLTLFLEPRIYDQETRNDQSAIEPIYATKKCAIIEKSPTTPSINNSHYRFTFFPLLFFFFSSSPPPPPFPSPLSSSAAFLFFPSPAPFTVTIVDLPFPPAAKLPCTCFSAVLQSAEASLMAYLCHVTERLGYEHEFYATRQVPQCVSMNVRERTDSNQAHQS